MQISLIVAMAKNRVIGTDNQLPWHLPADLRHFKSLTLGKPIVMGRKTYESIGKPLPGRTNIILTQQPNYHAEGCLVVHSIDAVLSAANDTVELMIIGGSTIYAEFLPLAQKIYLTEIDAEIVGDAYFPELTSTEWQKIAHENYQADEKNAYNYSFVTLERSV